ncbi:MAG: GIY-YIG nuclease family protein [Candidatus Neomarinimicrobiota bacterium]
MNYILYIIKSEVDGSFYIGYSSDIEKRLAQHNSGMSFYTSRKSPWKLVHVEEYKTKREAIYRERYLKSLKSHQKIKELVQ